MIRASEIDHLLPHLKLLKLEMPNLANLVVILLLLILLVFNIYRNLIGAIAFTPMKRSAV